MIFFIFAYYFILISLSESWSKEQKTKVWRHSVRIFSTIFFMTYLDSSTLVSPNLFADYKTFESDPRLTVVFLYFKCFFTCFYFKYIRIKKKNTFILIDRLKDFKRPTPTRSHLDRNTSYILHVIRFYWHA